MSTTNELLKKVAPAKARQNAVVATKKPGTMLDIVRSQNFQKQMAMALPKTLTAERLTRIVMTECRKVPQLLECNKESFFGAILQCAQLGLEPGSALGHCYLLPFGEGKGKDGKRNCQLIIGYRGMLDLSRRSGQILSINAYCVFEADEFSYELGLHPDIRHKPSPLAKRGAMTYVYAVAMLKDGGIQFEVMSRAEIEAIRDESQGYKAYTSGRIKTNPWATDFEAMAKKTVIRRLFKYLPVSIETARAVEIDEKTDRGEAVTENDFIDAEYEDKGTKLQRVTPEDEPEEETQEATQDQPPQPIPVEEAPTQSEPPVDEEWLKAYGR